MLGVSAAPCFTVSTNLIHDPWTYKVRSFFSQIAKSYYKSDVFNENDLQLVAQQFSHVVIDHGGIVRMWREKVGEKYTSLPDLHDFVILAVPPNKIVMKVREKCYTGGLHDTPTKVKKDFNATDSCIPKVTDSYSARRNLRSLSENKMGHLQQMYANFIQERWPDFICYCFVLKTPTMIEFEHLVYK